MLISFGGKKIFGLSESRYIALFGMALIVFAQPWGYTSLISMGTWLIFLSAFFSLLKIASIRFTKQSHFVILSLLVLSFFSLLASTTIAFNSFTALFCFWEIPIFWEFSNNSDLTFKKAIYIIFLIFSGYYFLLSFTSVAHKYIGPYGEVIHAAFTLGYNNPNQLGMYLVVCLFVLFSALAFFKNPWLKCLFTLSILSTSYLIIGSESRACIIIGALYAIYYFFFSKSPTSLISTKLVNWVIFFPLIILVFILFFGEVYQNFLVLGEQFDTGRMNIFSTVFRNYSLLDLIFGNFSVYQFRNLHNGYLAIFATVGLVVTILFIVFLQNKLNHICYNVPHRHQRLAFIALLLLIIHMSFEAALFTSGSVYAVSIMSLVWIASNEDEEA